MKRLLPILILILIFSGCVIETKWKLVRSGLVAGYNYIPAGWNQSATTVIRFREGGSVILNGHWAMPNQKQIWIYRKKGNFYGEIFPFKLTRKSGKYYLYKGK